TPTLASLPTPVILPPGSNDLAPTIGGDRRIGSAVVAGTSVPEVPKMSTDGTTGESGASESASRNSLGDNTFEPVCHPLSWVVEVHPTGFEPVTFGSVD